MRDVAQKTACEREDRALPSSIAGSCGGSSDQSVSSIENETTHHGSLFCVGTGSNDQSASSIIENETTHHHDGSLFCVGTERFGVSEKPNETAVSRAGIANIKILRGDLAHACLPKPGPKKIEQKVLVASVFAEAGTKKNRTESPRSEAFMRQKDSSMRFNLA